MTDDERKRVDGLLASYGALEGTQGRHDERLAGHDREFRNLREARREDQAEMTKALEAIDRSCGEKVTTVHNDLGDLRKELRDRDKAAAERKQRAEWTLFQKLGLFLASLGPIIAALALVWPK